MIFKKKKLVSLFFDKQKKFKGKHREEQRMISRKKGLTPDEQKELKDWEEKINSTLIEEYKPGGRVIVLVKLFPAERVMKELRRRAEKSRWILTAFSDNMGGYRTDGIKFH